MVLQHPKKSNSYSILSLGYILQCDLNLSTRTGLYRIEQIKLNYGQIMSIWYHPSLRIMDYSLGILRISKLPMSRLVYTGRYCVRIQDYGHISLVGMVKSHELI
jgi:hypothetical protein